jgi:hypothetical protein
MRKFTPVLVAALVLAIAAVAYAQSQVNTYTVTGSTNPATAGSKKKPRPIGIKFNFSVSEASNLRPGVIEKYTIRFGGTRVNTSVAAKCAKSKLENGGPKNCPSRSIVGTGYIENETGASNNPSDKSIQCNAALSVVNHGSNKASIYVEGDPNQSDPRRKCAINLAAAIPATFRNTSSGSELTFAVPQSLRHPGSPGISNAVKKVNSTIKKITKKGKGFYEARGGCKSRKRELLVTFRTESGDTDRVRKQVKC